MLQGVLSWHVVCLRSGVTLPPAAIVNDSTALRISRIAERIISQPHSPYHTPGLVAAWTDGNATQVVALGTDARGNKLTETTPFTLASVSTLALSLAVLRLVDEKRVGLDQPLGTYIESVASKEARVTIRRLLSHTAGLPLEFDTSTLDYSTSLTRAQVIDACLRTPLAFEPGSIVQHSNVAHALLSLVVESITGTGYHEALKNLVVSPLAIEAWLGSEAPENTASIMGIESPHVGTELEPWAPFWRSLELPWANLTATASGLLRLVRAFSLSGPLSKSVASEATTSQSSGLAGGFTQSVPFLGFGPSRILSWDDASWGLGVELKGTKKPHWTPLAATPHSFGQLGSSGVLCWHEPAAGMSWALCGCRSTDSGWLIRYGPALGEAILKG